MNFGNVSFKSVRNKSIVLGGAVGKLLNNITERWLTQIVEADPAIIDMFKYPELKPYRPLLPWSGEFAGKYLTGAAQIYSYTGNERLGAYISGFVKLLIDCQQPNGYLGPYPKEFQLTGRTTKDLPCYENTEFQPEETWDCWGHYHIMRGLMLWNGISGDETALDATKKIADLFCNSFYGPGKKRLSETGCSEMNLSPIHSFSLLYQKTGCKKYLDFAMSVFSDMENEQCGDFYRQALAGVPFYRMTKPRWEGMHVIEGIEALYEITGDSDKRRAFENLWWSITETDLHNTGGFTTDEQAMGTPFKEGRIETCCTIAYMAVTVDMLRLTGNSICADVLEWCFLNSGIGAFSPSGRWSVYDTPMRGYKRASHQAIGFQSRPGSPDLNCCSVNAPRAFGFLTDWAYMEDSEGLVINYFGLCDSQITLENGATVTVRQETDYPSSGHIRLFISSDCVEALAVKIRIPFWSGNAKIRVGGESAVSVSPGGYYTVKRVWDKSVLLELTLDFSLQFLKGEKDFEGLGSIYYGPLLLCLDPIYNQSVDYLHPPILDATDIRVEKVSEDKRAGVLVRVSSKSKSLVLCDLYTAGVCGTPYTSWLPLRGVEKNNFSKYNPRRTTIR